MAVIYVGAHFGAPATKTQRPVLSGTVKEVALSKFFVTRGLMVAALMAAGHRRRWRGEDWAGRVRAREAERAARGSAPEFPVATEAGGRRVSESLRSERCSQAEH